jgi:nucleotide-binding universal stress UspA family protein
VTEENKPGSIVLAAIDASPHSLAALDSAARLASRLHAELRGMYVEDIDLVRIAELPFARAITSLGQSQRLTPEMMLRQLNRHAALARSAVQASGTRGNLSWSFSVVRGSVLREIAEAASSADLVAIGRRGWSDSTAKQLGSVARALINSGTSSVLMVAEGGVRDPLAVIYDGSASSDRALALAAVLDGNGSTARTIFAIGTAAAERLKSAGIPEQAHVTTVDSQALLSRIQRSGVRTLVVPSTSLAEFRDSLALLEQKNLSIFLVK